MCDAMSLPKCCHCGKKPIINNLGTIDNCCEYYMENPRMGIIEWIGLNTCGNCGESKFDCNCDHDNC